MEGGNSYRGRSQIRLEVAAELPLNECFRGLDREAVHGVADTPEGFFFPDKINDIGDA